MESLSWPILLLAVLPLLAFLTSSVLLFLLLIRFLRSTLLQLQESSLQSTQNLTLQLSSQLSESQQQVLSQTASSVSELAKLLGQSATLLATKDPLAYQMVAGANAFTSDGGTDPYTSSDGEAEAEAQAGEQAMADALAAIMSFRGAPIVDDLPYPSASAASS